MILVVGATGQLGGLITRRLLQRGEGVHVLVRPGRSPRDLIAAGAHAVTGDLKDRGSLRLACEGVDTVITTANSTARGAPDTLESVDLHGNLNLIEVAETAGVHRFLFVSALGADPGHPEHGNGVDPPVFQPNVFMDKLIPLVVGMPALAGEPVTLVGSGDRRHSFVAMRDVAAYELQATYGVEPTPLSDYVRGFLRSARPLPTGGSPDVVSCCSRSSRRRPPLDNEPSKVHSPHHVRHP